MSVVKRPHARPIHLVLALIGSFFGVLSSGLMADFLHGSGHVVEAIATLIIALLTLILGLGALAVGAFLGWRRRDPRAGVVAGLGLMLTLLMLYLAAGTQEAYYATLAGIFASLVIAAAALRPEDMRL
jgi:hypothetical protein